MSTTYNRRRGQLEEYFDRTASDTWKRLTSDAPVSKVRQTVRAGRDEMRARLISWLPEDMSGMRLLDAGCGTGALSVEVAARGAEVVGVDVAGSLIEIAKARTPEELTGQIDFRTGDMLDEAHGQFDYVVAMDSLIHYTVDDIALAIGKLAERTQNSILFTHAPSTPMLMLMYNAGKLFPRSDRSPAIAPVSRRALSARMLDEPILSDWREDRAHRVKSGFYQSSAVEVTRV